MKGKIILTSFGVHTPLGNHLIAKSLSQEECACRKILLITLPEYELDHDLIFWCRMLGFSEQNITVFHEGTELADFYDIIYVSEGNTFEILEYIRNSGLVEFIKNCIGRGACYIGASAGAYIAGTDIEAALPFDKNRTGMTDFTALGLFNGVVIPHYDGDDERRYLSYKRAKDSGKYEYVLRIADEEAEVLSKGPFGKLLRKKVFSDTLEEQDEAFQKFQFETKTGEVKEVTVLMVVTLKGKEYAVYAIENDDGTNDVDEVYVLQDKEGNEYPAEIDNPFDKEDIEEYVKRVITEEWTQT